MNSRQTLLQSRIQELQTRRDRLTRKLEAVSRQRDYENRIEEQLRMDAVITGIDNDRRQVEEELFRRPPRRPAPAPVDRSSCSIPTLTRMRHCGNDWRFTLKLLKRQGVIQDWHDRDISAGSEWAEQISHHLGAAPTGGLHSSSQ